MTPNAKPLTRSLHTRRAVKNIAKLILADRALLTREDAPSLFLCVLNALDNSGPTDEALTNDCIDACAEAIAEVNAERTWLANRFGLTVSRYSPSVEALMHWAAFMHRNYRESDMPDLWALTRNGLGNDLFTEATR